MRQCQFMATPQHRLLCVIWRSPIKASKCRITYPMMARLPTRRALSTSLISISSRPSQIDVAAFEMQRTADAAIRFDGVGKRFGETVAVDGVTLAIRAELFTRWLAKMAPANRHCLACSLGRTALSEGRIDVFGQTLQTGNVRASRPAGIVAIYQELTIVPSLSACANVFLGQTRSRFGFLSERAMRKRFGELCERLGVVISADVSAGALSVADQQMLEIIRALESQAKVLLLDEPTSALALRSETRCFSAFVNCAHKASRYCW